MDGLSILLTGGTGFLGTYIAKWLLENTDHGIELLIRAPHGEAERRLERAWWDWPEMVRPLGDRITLLPGDLTEPGMGLSLPDRERLVGEVSHIVHAAADTDLSKGLEEARSINLGGVEKVLELAEEIHRDHGLDRLCHISTAYVSGRRRGRIPEDELLDQGFHNNYERSKFEGEQRVRTSSLSWTIVRPGMVVGDSQNGWASTFNTLYYPLRLYLKGARVMPVRGDLEIDMVHVDQVAEAVGELTLHPGSERRTFHLTAPEGRAPTACRLMEEVREWGAGRGLSLPRAIFLPLPLPRSASRGRGNVGALRLLAPYLRGGRCFDRSNTEELLGSHWRDWRETLPALMDFALYHGFFHRSERTVHEQALFRMSGTNLPVRYFDLVEGEECSREPGEVRGEVLRAVSSLEALGLGKG
ncbi:MAG: SDR family oxidoreductase, partial [Methanomassiliicoccales archaeon]